MKFKCPELNTSTSGIAALIEGMQLAKSNSKEFYLTDVSNEVMKVIELAHLDKFFKIKNATGQNASDDTAAPAPNQSQKFKRPKT